MELTEQEIEVRYDEILERDPEERSLYVDANDWATCHYWRCNNCGKFFDNPQEVMSNGLCKQCNKKGY